MTEYQGLGSCQLHLQVSYLSPARPNKVSCLSFLVISVFVFYFPDLRNKNENLTTDERIALEIYEAMRSKKGKQNVEDSDEENEGLPEPMDEDNGAGKVHIF